MTVHLQRQGVDVNAGTVHGLVDVERLIRGVCGRTYRTTILPQDSVRAGELVIRNFTTPALNPVWVADSTFCRTWSGCMSRMQYRRGLSLHRRWARDTYPPRGLVTRRCAWLRGNVEETGTSLTIFCSLITPGCLIPIFSAPIQQKTHAGRDPPDLRG